MIKKLLFFIFFICLSTAQITAQVIASDNFDSYTPSNNIGGGTGGTGWAAPWEIITGDDKAVIADSIKNFRTGIATGTVLDVDFLEAGNNVRMDRRLATPITDDGNTYWLAFDANYEGTVGGNASVVSFANTAATAPGGPDGQLIIFGRVAQGDGQSFGVGFNSGNNRASTPKASGAHWIVAKLEFSGDAAEDTVYLFINPDPSIEPTNDMADAKFGSTALNDGFDGIFIKNEGTVGVRTTYDNLILGNNFSDVFPTGTNTVPLYRPVIEKFDYTAGTGLNGQGVMGDGWSGGWDLIGGSDVIIQEGGIQNPNILVSTSSNKVLFDQTVGATRIQRELSETYEDNGLTYWFSFFADFTDAANGHVMNVMLINSESEQMEASGPNGQFLQIGKSPTDLRLGVGTVRPGFQFVDSLIDLANQPHWFVARIEMSGDDEADTVRLFLNPTPGVEPQVGEEDIIFAAPSLNDGWQAVGIKIEGNPPTLSSNIDEVYLGLSFDEVTPGDLISVNFPDPAFDNFDYAESTPLSPSDSIGTAENGWSGPWKSRIGSTIIEEDSIINPFNNSATTLNSLAMDNNGELRLFRELSSFYEDNGLTYWFGFWMDIDFNGTGEVMQVILGDTDALGTGGPGGQFLRTGRNFDSGNIVSFSGDGTHDTGVSADTARWVVMKIQTNGNSAADSVKIFVDPSPDEEPEDATVSVAFATNALNNGWNGVIVKTSGVIDGSGGETSVEGIVDNIYIGTSFDDIVPNDLVDVTPFFTAGPAYEPFNYDSSIDLAGNGIRRDGFGGPWRRSSGDTVIIDAGSIETEFTIFEGNKALINYDTLAVAYDRPLSGRFEDDSSTVWVSFLIDFREVTRISTEGFLTLMNGEEEVISFGRTSGFNRIGLTWDPEIFQFITDVSSDGEHWIVVRIDMSGDDEAEEIYMWVDPLPQFQPNINQASTFTTPEFDQRLTINDGFDGIRINIRGGTPFSMSIDEIRLGFSFSDVSTIEEEIPENTIARDQFQYGVGDPLLGLGGEGSQWGGSWEDGFGAGGPAIIGEGSLSNGSNLQTDGNHVVLDHNTETQVRLDRELAEPVEDDGNEYWVSFLARFESVGLTNVVYLSFINNRDFGGQNVQRVGIGKIFEQSTVGLFSRSDPNTTSAIPIDDGSTKWYLGRLQFSGDTLPDILSVWVDHNPEEQPDLENPDLVLETTALNQGFQSFQFRAESAGTIVQTQFFVDELRFGTTYESVAPTEGTGGGGIVTGIDDLLDNAFKLTNYPNPFTDNTTIQYELEETGEVKLSIINLQGQEVTVLYEGRQSPGNHTVNWDGSNGNSVKIPSGLYFYRLESNGQSVIKRMIYLQD
ncbi:MAG: T9SS type A sorting domain-containing protein [Bacteroidota bacterium]